MLDIRAKPKTDNPEHPDGAELLIQPLQLLAVVASGVRKFLLQDRTPSFLFGQTLMSVGKRCTAGIIAGLRLRAWRLHMLQCGSESCGACLLRTRLNLTRRICKKIKKSYDRLQNLHRMRAPEHPQP